jgi:hypothetical protein
LEAYFCHKNTSLIMGGLSELTEAAADRHAAAKTVENGS